MSLSGMRSTSVRLAAAAVLATVVTPCAAAQPCTGPVSPNAGSFAEFIVDDEYPFGSGSWIGTNFMSGLGVATADFDKNNVGDVVLSGNGAVPVRILHLHKIGGTVLINDVEDIALPTGAYAVDVGDFDEDGASDLVVGRRVGDKFVTQGLRDTIFLNDQNPGPAPDIAMFDAGTTFSLNPSTALENLTVAAAGETFGIEVAHLNGADAPLGGSPALHLDIVSVGAYGIRYYRGNGDGTFTHMATLRELDALGQPTPQVYRNLVFGDVDGDTDLDLVVVRSAGTFSVTPASDRVWFNQQVNPFTTGVQFALAPSGMSPQDLMRAPVLHFEWKQLDLQGQEIACGTTPVGGEGSFDADLGDLDHDGDRDLVVASVGSRNVAYLNDGTGHFGSSNGTADGMPAAVFMTATEDWPDMTGGFAESQYLYEAVKLLSTLQGTALPAHGSWTEFVFRVDGKILDMCTSVRINEMTGDQLPEVAFANRNDIQELCYNHPGPSALPPGPLGNGGYYYLSPTKPAPPVYDHMFLNTTTAGGLSFGSCVERIGEANDGTAYFEFVRLGADGKLDWIECNFANWILTTSSGVDYLTDDGVTSNTAILFGQTIPGTSWPLCGVTPPGP